MIYGQEDDNAIITSYPDSNLEGGIKQCNLDHILDLIDEYVELVESIEEEGKLKIWLKKEKLQ